MADLTGARPRGYIDLENMIGAPWASLPVAEVRHRTDEIVQFLSGVDLTVIACSGLLALVWDRLSEAGAVMHAVPPKEDAADHHLIHLMTHHPPRIGTVVLASGDGIFAPTCRLLEQRDHDVIVVLPHRGASRHLRAHHRRCVVLPSTPAIRVASDDFAVVA